MLRTIQLIGQDGKPLEGGELIALPSREYTLPEGSRISVITTYDNYPSGDSRSLKIGASELKIYLDKSHVLATSMDECYRLLAIEEKHFGVQDMGEPLHLKASRAFHNGMGTALEELTGRPVPEGRYGKLRLVGEVVGEGIQKAKDSGWLKP